MTYQPTPPTDAGVLLTSAARTATVATSEQKNPKYKGIILFVNVTAATGTSPTLTPHLQVVDPANGTAQDYVVASAAITGTGEKVYVIYPGASGGSPTQAVSLPLPGTWLVNFVIGGTTPSFTFTASYVYLS